MELTEGIRCFVAVVETGSFTGAAHRLGISNKLASKYVAELERRLGRALLYRTTRAMSLTDAGATYLPHARKVLDALDVAAAALDAPKGTLSGRLRMTCGATMGELCVADAVRDFLDQHPAMRVELHLADDFTDLAAGGFDLAVRIGIPRDSSLKMARIGSTTPLIAASPDYLRRFGTPKLPQDLENHVAIIDLNEDIPGRWRLTQKKEHTVAMQGQMSVNSAAVAITQALAGHGLLRAPDIFLAPHLASGALIAVLRDYTTDERPIHMLSHPTGFREAGIAAFGALLRDRLRQLAGG